MIIQEELMLLTRPAHFEPITFGPGAYTWEVPKGVRKIKVDCVGSAGYSNTQARGGLGGRVLCNLRVIGRQVLYILVGTTPTGVNRATYNASDIRIGGNDYSSRVIIAGGGQLFFKH